MYYSVRKWIMEYSSSMALNIGCLIESALTLQERGQFARVANLCTTIMSCAFFWTLLEDAHSVTFSCAHVNLSGCAQLVLFLAV